MYCINDKMNKSESEPEPSTSAQNDEVPKKKSQTALFQVTSKLSGAEKRKIDKALSIKFDYPGSSTSEHY